MKQLKNYFENSNKKIQYLIIMIVIVLVASIAIPSYARYKNRTFSDSIIVWDGTVARSYRKGSGTIDDPYIISNGSELAYFSEQLKNKVDYTNTYFELNNDIVLNDGIFSYNETDGIKYTKNNTAYSITPYTNNYELGTINLFNSLDNFKGHFNGNSYRIYGLYITDKEASNLGLFTNLQGSVSDLYVENSLIYGGNITGGIASNASNTTLKNVLYNGYVVGNAKEETITINIDDIIKNTSNEEIIDNINIDIPNFNGVLDKVTLTGNYNASNEFGSLKINNQEITSEEFEIELDLSSLEFKYSSTSDTTFNLSNLKYNITYKNNNTAGIIGIGDNITLENVINKANIYGDVYASGLIDTANNEIIINNSYNRGNISSTNMSTGIIRSIKNNSANTSITSTYNSGTLVSASTSSFIGEALNSNINITNSFSTTNDYAITKIENSNVNISNSYMTHYNQVNSGALNTPFTVTTIDNLKNKTYLNTYLGLNEFVSEQDLKENENNIWVFEENNLPILFIDDLNSPIASINVSTYSWNNLSYNLNALKFDSNIAFNIERLDNLRPIKETYYYISYSKEALTKEQLEEIQDWKTYENITEIKEQGYYVIYAKVVDYNDNITYLNTDILVLDLTGAEIDINLNDNNWTSFKTNLNNTYIPKKSNLEITAVDDISGVSAIYYYKTNEELTQNQLENLESNNWILYTEKIPIENDSVIYVKVEDNVGYVTYANTDKIIINGYNQTKLTAGRNIASSDNISITNKSSITFNYNYTDTNPYEVGYKHKLISSILLPKNTEITLIDNINNKVYKYKIETEEDIYGYTEKSYATYSLNSFNEVGKASMNKQFTDLETGEINEDFSITLDFKNTDIKENIMDAYLYMEIQDENGDMIRPTLTDTIKKYNVFVNKDANLYLNTNYTGSIDYNSDSVNDILLNTGLTYKYNNSQIVYDTTYENKNLVLALRLLDNNKEVVSKNYLKNIVFKIGETKYFAGNDNIVRINLEDLKESISKTLTIETYADNIKIKSGSYKFEIGVMASYDGNYSDNINYSINVPVTITNHTNDNYNFDVIMDSKIINKNENTKLSFNILQKGYFINPNIRVSLYKKDSLSGDNQNYTRIDMQEYVTNTLTKYSDNIYYASINPVIYDGTSNTYNLFELNFDKEKLENHGYMCVFELYDGNTKIGTIQKKFIVK